VGTGESSIIISTRVERKALTWYGLCFSVLARMEKNLAENADLWSLFEVICNLRKPTQCAEFFRDLCTLNELEAMAERWGIVQLLDRGLPYREISQVTGASTATVTRIAHWLRYGEGGYEAALRELRSEEK
jgi:TrpR-related protein YerC/YecD